MRNLLLSCSVNSSNSQNNTLLLLLVISQSLKQVPFAEDAMDSGHKLGRIQLGLTQKLLLAD